MKVLGHTFKPNFFLRKSSIFLATVADMKFDLLNTRVSINSSIFTTLINAIKENIQYTWQDHNRIEEKQHWSDNSIKD